MASVVEIPSSGAAVNEPSADLNLFVKLRLLDPTPTTVSGKILRVDHGFLQLHSPIRIDPETKLELVIDDCTMKAEVVSCAEHKPIGFHLGIRRVYGPQRAMRAEPRVPVDFSAVLKTPSHGEIFARVIDMSQSGLGLELSNQVAVGTRVSVQFAPGIAFGEVRHCQLRGRTYRTGLRIHEFVVRKPLDVPKGHAHAHRPLSALWPGILGRLHSMKTTLVCSLLGHDYHWSLDLWERSVLRCGRCHRDLDASTH